MITNRSLLAVLLATTLALPAAPALAEVNPPAGMVPNAANATLPDARNNLGAGPGNGVNVVKDYGADPTGGVDATTALQNAVNFACNNASPVFQSKDVFIPDGIYLLSGAIPVTNGCWIHGQVAQTWLGRNGGGTKLQVNGATFVGDLFQIRGFGQFKISDLEISTTGGNQTGGASYCRVHAAGANYALNDTITLTGGTFTTATVLKVTALSGNTVTGCVITTPGTYSVAPSPVAAVAQGSSSGSGTGATFDMVYASAAAISLSGPTTKLTADAASGASALTVASIAGFANGDAIAIEQDNGVYLATTVSGAPSGNTINLAGTLSFKASANHPVYDTYVTQPLVDNVTCTGFWDCLRVDNASQVRATNYLFQDYGHDGIIKTSGANPDNGGDIYRGTAWDFTRGTSNAGLEVLAGGGINASGSFFQRSNHSVLVNSFFGPTGTLLLSNISSENALVCSVRVHQSISGIEYGNIDVVGGEFSNISYGLTGQHFCVDAGTPNTNPKWTRNLVFANNHVNSYFSGSNSTINVQDGDNIVVTGNALNNNNVSGPTAISIAGAATHAVEAGNQATLYPTGKYGAMLSGALTSWQTPGQAVTPPAAATLTTNQSQAAGGSTLLPFVSTTGASVGQIVQATNVPLGDEVLSIVATAQVSLTANGISASAQKVVTTTATAGSAVGQQCTDVTTPTAIGAGNVIATIQAGVSITMTANLTAATVNADTITCNPVVTLTKASSGTISSGASIAFIANAAALASASASYNQGDQSTNGNLNVGGALNAALGSLYGISLQGGTGPATFPMITSPTASSGIMINAQNNGTNAGIRVINNGTIGELAATDETGSVAFKILNLNGSSISFQSSGTPVGTATSTGLNAMVIGATTPAAGTFTALAGTSGTHTGVTGFGLRDTSAAFDVTLAATSSTALGAGRILTLDMKNVAHTLALNATANTITFPNTASYTLVGSADSGTVTGTMIASGTVAGGNLTSNVTLPAGGNAPSGFTLTDAINQEFEVSTSTLTKTSDTALATVPGLSQNLTAGKTYQCRGHLTGTANASGGIKVALTAGGSLSATSTTWTGFTWNAGTPVTNTTVTALGSNIAASTAVYSDVYIDGSIVVNVAGTINVQAAQNASFATPTTVLQGSTFSCVRVN